MRIENRQKISTLHYTGYSFLKRWGSKGTPRCVVHCNCTPRITWTTCGM